MKQNTGSGSYSASGECICKHNPYLKTKMLLGTPWIPSHCSQHSPQPQNQMRFKCVLHFSRCYNSDGTSKCVKIETCFFFPFWNLNSHMDHTSFNQDSENHHNWGTEGDHSSLLLTLHTVFSQRIYTHLIHAGRQEGERPLSQPCHWKCQSDRLDHDCHYSHWKAEVWLVSYNLQTQHCRAEHHNTPPGVPRAACWFPALTTAQLCLHLFGQPAVRKEPFFLAELLSVNCTGSFPTTL